MQGNRSSKQHFEGEFEQKIIIFDFLIKQSTPGNLIIHDAIQVLPLNILGILKNKVLNGKYGIKITKLLTDLDLKINHLRLMKGMPFELYWMVCQWKRRCYISFRICFPCLKWGKETSELMMKQQTIIFRR